MRPKIFFMYVLIPTKYIMGRKVIQMIKNKNNNPRFLIWGMDGDFTNYVLTGLMLEDLPPTAVIISDLQKKHASESITLIKPEPSFSSLPIVNPFIEKNIYQTAWENDVPLFKIHDLASETTHQTLKDLRPSIAIVACFPKRIPKEVLKLPPNGFLNLHPSLLPSLRGPYPLFWTFRLGTMPGISLHVMDEGLDTGNLVFQKNVAFSDGISGSQADYLMAKEGVNLLTKTIKMLETGSLVSNPQHGTSSTYSRPTSKDFSIPTSWAAQRAFNFIRGTGEWGQKYVIEGPDFTFRVRTAVSYNQDFTLKQSYQQKGADIWINFSPGLLHVIQ